MKQSGGLVEHLEILSDFIHYIQKERGYASLFLIDPDSFKGEIEDHFRIVDTKILAISALFDKKDGDYKSLHFLTSLKKIPDKRKRILDGTADPIRVVLFYTREVIAAATDLISELAVLGSKNSASRISAYVNFLQLKERVGLERAAGAVLAKRNFSKDNGLLEQIRHLILEQRAYERMFLSFIDDHKKSSLEKNLNQSAAVERIKNINNEIFDGSDFVGKIDVSAREWFSLFTEKMDLMREIETALIADITEDKEGDPIKNDQCVESGNYAEYFKTIRDLSIFIGLDELALRAILKHSYVRNYKKGTLLFLEGEQVVRLYIVLDGWVKLFCGNVDGKEAVLQIIGPGKGIAETAILLDSPFPASAKAVEDAKILSIPASIIREYIRSNRDLASNMLSNMATHSKELINQLSQMSLKTAQQRVGWFLLNLFLEGDKVTTKGHAGVRLPYDKALIASYLGMKPETLSRALQSLKEDDSVVVEKDLASLSDIKTLCKYCDSETSGKCKLHKTPECPSDD